MSGMTRQQERIVHVLNEIEKQLLVSVEDADIFAEALESMLTELHENDFFGTEGQCDPRGDFRNGEWSMWKVEGVDE